MAVNNSKTWSKSEDDLLLKYISQGITYEEMGKRLGRTTLGVSQRCQKLKKEVGPEVLDKNEAEYFNNEMNDIIRRSIEETNQLVYNTRKNVFDLKLKPGSAFNMYTARKGGKNKYLVKVIKNYKNFIMMEHIKTKVRECVLKVDILSGEYELEEI